MNIQEIRQQYPQYSDLSDQQLADGFHSKFYSDIPQDKFYGMLGITPQQSVAMKGLEQIQPSSVQTPVYQEPSLGEKVLGAGEAALSTATGLTSGALGYIAGGIKGIGESIGQGTFGTTQGTKTAGEEANRLAGMVTYAPRTDVGQEYAGKVGEALDPLMAIMPDLSIMHGITRPAIIRAPKEIRNYKPTNSVADSFIQEAERKVAPKEIPTETAPQEPVKQPSPVDETINKMSQDAQVGNAEMKIPTEEQGLSPSVLTDDLRQIMENRNQSKINAEMGGGVFIKDRERINQLTKDQPKAREEEVAWRQNQQEAFQEPTSPDLRKVQEDLAWEQRSANTEALQPSQMGSMKGRFHQGGAIDPSVFIEGIGKIKELLDKNNLREAFRVLGVHSKQDVLDLAEAVKERISIQQEPLNNKSGVLKDFVAKNKENVVDRLVKSADIYKWPEYSGFVPKGQRGSWTPFASSTKEQAAPKQPTSYQELRNMYPDKPESVIRQAWEGMSKYQAEQQRAKLLGGLNPIANRSFEDNIPIFKGESDIKKTTARDLFRSGGRMKALQTGNQLITWGVEQIYGNQRRSEVIAKEHTQNIIEAQKTLSATKGDAGLIKAVQALLEVEGKEGVKPNIEPWANNFVNTMRKAHDTLWTSVNDVRKQMGLREVPYRDNYIGSLFNGPYRASVRAMDKSTGKVSTIAVIAGKTMDDARAAVAHYREKMPDLVIDEPRFDKEYFESSKFRSKFEQMAVHMNELMTEFDMNSELGREFLDVAEKFYTDKMKKHLEYQQHFKSKKGVEGSEGNAPWRTAVENAHDLIDSQVKILEDGFEWVGAQKARMELNKILRSEDLNHQPNAKNYLENYFAKAFHKNAMMSIPRNINYWASEKLGISPSVMSEVSAVLNNFTLNKLLGWSGGFTATQIIQIPQSLATSMAYLRAKGIGRSSVELDAKANLLNVDEHYTHSYTRGMTDGMFAATHRIQHLSQEGKFFNEYAIKEGTYDPHIVEHVHSGSLIPTTGMSGFKKTIIENALNKPMKGIKAYNQLESQVFISALESSTRSSYYMTIAHYLHNSGYSLLEAAQMADRMTSTFFVDYHPTERPAIWDKIPFGKTAGTLKTYPMNYFNQMALGLNKNPKMWLVPAAMMTVLWGLTGMTGMPGMDSIDDAFQYATNGRFSPKGELLNGGGDLLTYGALSQMTGWSFNTKFSMNNIVDTSSPMAFLYPLASYWTKGLDKTMTAAKVNTKQAWGSALQAGLPPGPKALAEKFMLTNPNTKRTIISTGKLPEEVPTYERTKSDWAARSFGTYGNEEFRMKDKIYLATKQMRNLNLAQRKTLDKALWGYLAGDMEQVQENAQKFIASGGTIAALQKALVNVGASVNVDADTMQQLKAAKSKNPERINLMNEYNQ